MIFKKKRLKFSQYQFLKSLKVNQFDTEFGMVPWESKIENSFFKVFFVGGNSVNLHENVRKLSYDSRSDFGDIRNLCEHFGPIF